jgi:hypothetical protein
MPLATFAVAGTKGLSAENSGSGGLTPAARQLLLDPAARTSEVSNILHKISPEKIEPEFLAKIYNSTNFSNEHRRLCFFAVIRSLGTSGRSLSELAAQPNYPKWIREQDIHEVWAVTGRPVVDFPLGGHESVILIFPETEGGLSCVGIAFEQGYSLKEMLQRALQGEKAPALKDVRLKKLAFREAGK